jgi:hypothetical protein
MALRACDRGRLPGAEGAREPREEVISLSEDPRLDRFLDTVRMAASESPDDPVTWKELKRVLDRGMQQP